ncbi:hypothetical protein HDU93_000981 [Gonapodya sp. JEL0774]|nr:hypothetical protein HDU93_000981 [Gonapodya sp. JEL0774]
MKDTSLKVEKLRAEASLIVATYLQEGSSREIKIPDSARRHLLRNIELRILDGQIFVELEDAVLQLLDSQILHFLDEVSRATRSNGSNAQPLSTRSSGSASSVTHKPPLPGSARNSLPETSNPPNMLVTPSNEDPPWQPLRSPENAITPEAASAARRHTRNIVLQILNGEFHDAYMAYRELASKFYKGCISNNDTDLGSTESLDKCGSGHSLEESAFSSRPGGPGLDKYVSDKELEMLAKEAKRIANIFFGEQAPCELNITDTTTKRALAHLASQNYHPSVFRPAHEEVLLVLQTAVMPRFFADSQRSSFSGASGMSTGPDAGGALSPRRSAGDSEGLGTTPKSGRSRDNTLWGAIKDFTVRPATPSRKPSRGKTAAMAGADGFNGNGGQMVMMEMRSGDAR